MFAGWPLIVTLLIGAVWLARYVGPVSRDSESPLDILKKRYAKGEITKEEFDAIKKDLAA
jgi:putative membrane protein